MAKGAKHRKTFAGGDAVEVRPDVGAAWVEAEYLSPVTGMRGWHRVEGETLKRYINTMSGETTTPDDSGAILTHLRIVPTQRIRTSTRPAHALRFSSQSDAQRFVLLGIVKLLERERAEQDGFSHEITIASDRRRLADAINGEIASLLKRARAKDSDGTDQ